MFFRRFIGYRAGRDSLPAANLRRAEYGRLQMFFCRLIGYRVVRNSLPAANLRGVEDGGLQIIFCRLIGYRAARNSLPTANLRGADRVPSIRQNISVHLFTTLPQFLLLNKNCTRAVDQLYLSHPFFPPARPRQFASGKLTRGRLRSIYTAKFIRPPHSVPPAVFVANKNCKRTADQVKSIRQSLSVRPAPIPAFSNGRDSARMGA